MVLSSQSNESENEYFARSFCSMTADRITSACSIHASEHFHNQYFGRITRHVGELNSIQCMISCISSYIKLLLHLFETIMSSDIKTVNLTVALPPRDSKNVRLSIESKLTGLISHYVPEIDGVLIKWSDLNVLNDNGIIIDDQPYTFWKVTFTAQVFKPIEGKLVKGKVHQTLKSYFIAKAMNSFTVTVTIPENLATHSIVQGLMVDQDVYFKIKGSNEGAYRGDLDEECVELTSGLIRDESENNDDRGAYDYANDFEY